MMANIDTGTFQDIIKNKLDSPQAVSVINDTEMFIEAIKYYLENDDFID